MINPLAKRATLYLIGALLGGFVGFMIGEKITKEPDILEEEEKELPDLVSELSDDEGIPEDAIVVEGTIIRPGDEYIIEEDSEGKPKVVKKKKKGIPKKSIEETVDYTKYHRPNPHVERARHKEIVTKAAEESGEETPEDPSVPHIISFEDYVNTGFAHAKRTLTYYEADDTLCDDQENIVDDVNRMVGPDALVKFGTRSDDPNIVYVRNNRVSEDYEIIRNTGFYSEIVAGFPPEENPKRNKKRKGKIQDEDGD